MTTKSKYIFLFTLSFLVMVNCSQSSKGTAPEKNNYVFFLHNQFLEENDITAQHPEYGRAEYNEIINSLKQEGFAVISEKRKAKTNVKEYAQKVASQIESLLKKGVKPDHITIIGTSKGGYIAQYVSTFIANPNLNFVFIGSFQESDIENFPEINFCGNILTIYDKSDTFGVSAIRRKETSKLKINKFVEVELDTKLKHGFLYKPLKEWLEPSKMWAKRNYNFEINKEPKA